MPSIFIYSLWCVHIQSVNLNEVRCCFFFKLMQVDVRKTHVDAHSSRLNLQRPHSDHPILLWIIQPWGGAVKSFNSSAVCAHVCLCVLRSLIIKTTSHDKHWLLSVAAVTQSPLEISCFLKMTQTVSSVSPHWDFSGSYWDHLHLLHNSIRAFPNVLSQHTTFQSNHSLPFSFFTLSHIILIHVLKVTHTSAKTRMTF